MIKSIYINHFRLFLIKLFYFECTHFKFRITGYKMKVFAQRDTICSQESPIH